jgi:purine/pyrimidine-nucleoside phosphorylase
MSTPTALEFAQVTVLAKANVYFDGKVVSHGFVLPDGSRKSLGLIYPGEYHFGTGAKERMDIIAGTCRVRLDGSEESKDYGAGTSFSVPGNSGFSISVAAGITEYVCSYE